jgi:hypothetical protein
MYPSFLLILLVIGNIEGGGRWRRQGRYAKSKVDKTASFTEVKTLKKFTRAHT